MSPLEPLARPEWLPEPVWPWPTGALPTPAGRLAVTDVGTGPTLLLVHTGMWSFVWRDLLYELAPRFRCVTLDAPGNGRSYHPGPAGTTLAAAASAIRAVIDALDLRDVTLVAHDLGGPAGLTAAAERPDRIAAIAAVNTFGRDGRRAIHRYLADARRESTLYATIDAALRGPLSDRPLLTVFGRYNDPLRLQPRWKALFPAARQEIVPQGNHFPMCDAPAQVATWIREWHTDDVATRRATDAGSGSCPRDPRPTHP